MRIPSIGLPGLVFVLCVVASSAFALTHDPGLKPDVGQNIKCFKDYTAGFALEGDGERHDMTYYFLSNCGGDAKVIIKGRIIGVSQFEDLYFWTNGIRSGRRSGDRIGFNTRVDGATGIFGISFVDRGDSLSPGHLYLKITSVPLPAGMATVAGSLGFLGFAGTRCRKTGSAAKARKKLLV